MMKLESRKNIYKKAAVIFVCLCILVSAKALYAATPIDQVKSDIDQIIAVLDDKSYRESHSREELQKKLREIAYEGFDWGKIARRSLGLYWKERSEEEKKEFTSLLIKILENAYVNKLIDSYSGEKVLYGKEIIDGDRALVETRIIDNAEREVSVRYRLHKKGDRWVAYDVIIEGVSLVKNYRVQFYDIIRQSSYEELIKKLKKKEKDYVVKN
ncbi:MAG: ABC transporter substrate-binding protein [Deltaproteobacteria bacterium]|nr:ABC transporter substrate-binding protein [Deltaproteobacteria bacterium]NOQ86654.1 ABC transporter substrate-binding protein [Deltaproteobacteria bacterium]